MSVFFHSKRDLGSYRAILDQDVKRRGQLSLLTAMGLISSAQVACGQATDGVLSEFVKFPEEIPTEFWVTLAVLTIYLIFVFVIRFIWVIQPSIIKIRATQDILRSREGEIKNSDVIKSIESLSKASSEFVKKNFSDGGHSHRLSTWFSFTGKQLAAWKLLHEIERHLLLDNRYAELHARSIALAALQRLQRLPESPTRLRFELQKKLGDDDSYKSIRPLVQEARALIFAYEEELLSTASDARNKGMFLSFLSIASIAFLAYIFPSTTLLFLAGALGGILSRLRKATLDDGAAFEVKPSWSVMFLAPVVGALSAWFGILIVQALIDLEILGSSLEIGFPSSNNLVTSGSLNGTNGWTLLLSFIFGWSATLFDSVIDKLEGRIEISDEGAIGTTQTPREREIEGEAMSYIMQEEQLRGAASRPGTPEAEHRNE